MDTNSKLTVSDKPATRPDLEAVKRAYEMIDRADVIAGVDELLQVCHDDVEMRAYAASAVAAPGVGGRELLRGKDEIRRFFRDSADSGVVVVIRTRGFALEGDMVVVRGTIRVARPDSSFAEANVRWNYQFLDGLIHRINWEQRAGD